MWIYTAYDKLTHTKNIYKAKQESYISRSSVLFSNRMNVE